MDPQLVQIINFGQLVIFVILALAAVIRIAFRIYEYKRDNLPLPALIKRDLGLFVGLALPFLGVIYFRVVSIVPREETWYPAWAIGSGTAAILGVAYWVYYEYFKVEK